MTQTQTVNTTKYFAGFDSMRQYADILDAASDVALIRWLKELEEDKCDYSNGCAAAIKDVLEQRR